MADDKKLAARIRAKAWREKYPERAKEAIAKCKAAKPEKYKALQRQAYLRNLAARKSLSAQWRKDHPERQAESIKRWIKKNPERRREIANNWRKRNPDKCNAVYARRRAAKKNAAPKWANNFFISEIYDLAKRRSKATGFKWHVDHIVPLTSPIVCGLHVEHNLQVIPASLNLSKNNRQWPDMP